MTDKLYIRNMVCDRCRMAVQRELENSGVQYETVELGEVKLKSDPTKEQLQNFSKSIAALGFELLEDKTVRTISTIKNAIIDFVRNPESAKRKVKFSVFLSDKLNKDYNTLSSLFSENEGTTIEQYLIHQKIERTKELLVYDELSLSEIAHQLGYSSVQHLSNQFKKITGLTPSHFKKLGEKKRIALDKVAEVQDNRRVR